MPQWHPSKHRSTNNNQKPPVTAFNGGIYFGAFGYCANAWLQFVNPLFYWVYPFVHEGS